MNIQDYTDEWIAENIDTKDYYGKLLEENIRSFVSLIIRLPYFGITLEYFVKFLNDYQKDRM